MKHPVIIVGSSGHAKVIIDIFEKEGRCQILGLLDPYKNKGEEVLGYKIIGKEEDLPQLISKSPDAKIFVAIGDNWIRGQVVQKVKSLVPHVDFASTIHPFGIIAKNVSIGCGTAIMAGAVVNSNAVIGDFAIINTQASVDHDCSISNFSSLAPNATLGGSVTIGEFSAVSISATIKHGIIVGKHSVVGAGALLLNECPDNSIMYGVPAKLIRKREIGERYL